MTSAIARKRVRLGLRYAGATIVTGAFVFPIYWLFMTSFKTPEEIFASPPQW
jgi:multiple sugar transport system permease protein